MSQTNRRPYWLLTASVLTVTLALTASIYHRAAPVNAPAVQAAVAVPHLASLPAHSGTAMN